uniref:Ubiquitin-like-conjugating enzyme ATG10 n=1 Tax=Parasteatoda tepidariorum TaxID=114398 RepID=A0A2L2YHT8_PARTP|nr:ubiquitin-like-conjugating enzyme ATG10 [Parasteatoda tepidariorum]XP_015907456.1 ubiquitin-like-conjugating enzyme ATG10 [Parasteatoda tepidariorum]XP_015907457.1 ubiquitin-like-conjugating enzyme ATG10 [Parasteatoda tepidariorum]XP_015907459.1 ubiquitin-like-conjugating enzyme ATG10 [Parasteatoda tepidariorum]
MTLQYEQFKKFASEFVSISSNLGDEWVLKSIKKGPEEEVYLEKRILKPDNKDNDIPDIDRNEIEQMSSFKIFVYHIIYSQSYSVPVLCFNANHEDGKLLSLDEIWNEIPKCYGNLPENKWNMLTQQEHPKLGIPCFMIHPCYTADLMSACKSSNYIISWLSIIGPIVGLNLSLQYAKFTQKM